MFSGEKHERQNAAGPDRHPCCGIMGFPLFALGQEMWLFPGLFSFQSSIPAAQ